MSIKFDKANDGGDGDWIKADDDTLMEPSIPFSVSIWFYFEPDFEAEETQTIWFYGDKGESDEYLVLEVVVSSGTKLQAHSEAA